MLIDADATAKRQTDAELHLGRPHFDPSVMRQSSGEKQS
jgi:hypothetical protein